MSTAVQITLIICITIVSLVVISEVSEYLKDNKED